jgi:hypothetical protein
MSTYNAMPQMIDDKTYIFHLPFKGDIYNVYFMSHPLIVGKNNNSVDILCPQNLIRSLSLSIDGIDYITIFNQPTGIETINIFNLDHMYQSQICFFHENHPLKTSLINSRNITIKICFDQEPSSVFWLCYDAAAVHCNPMDHGDVYTYDGRSVSYINGYLNIL